VLIKPVYNTDYSEADQVDHILWVRRRLLRGMLIALVVLGLPTVGISCIEAIKLGQLGGVILYGGIYLLVSATTICFYRLPFIFCAGVMLSSLYVIAAFNLVHFSFAGAGIVILITISVLATVLLGIRSGLITAATCLCTLITIGLCFVYGVIGISPEMPATTAKAISWVTAAAVFALLTISLILSSGMLQGYLIKSLESLKHKTEELENTNKNLTREIKQRKMTEAKLKQSETQFRTLFETAPDAIYLTDLKGILLDGNRIFEELIGSPREVFIGKNFIDTGLLPKREISRVVKLMEKSIKGESTGPDELALICSTGKATTLEILTSPFQLEDQPVILSIARDVSERKRLENRLNQAQKMEAIGTLAGGVAHDLNNVLSAQVGYPDLILMDLPENSPLKEPILRIQESGQKAAAIVQDLLTMARRGVVVADVMNLNQLVDNYINSPEYAKLKLFHPYAIIRSKLDADLLNIMGSTVHLFKTIMNLVNNAAEAMSDGGDIIISTQNQYIDKPVKGYDTINEGDYAVLKVSDSGKGIASKDIERIFEPFYTKKVMGRSGTGLGMAVVWGTVQDHKGYIDVQSTPNIGTTFILYFPVTRKKISEEKNIVPLEEYTGNGESILVVDDVEGQRKIASDLLKKLNYSVTSVASGEQAVDYMKKNSADLIILDMIMDPGIDGCETYKQILELHPEQKAIITSGFSESDRVKEAQSLGAGEYIKKPYLFEKIGIAVKKELEKQIIFQQE